MSQDDMGDRMKALEAAEAGRRLMPLLPIMVRLDGRGFSRFTKGMQRPYDGRMSGLMGQTTRYLVEETNATIGYTQSDEISLVLYSDSYKSQTFFDGRIQKLCSTLAAMATLRFNQGITEAFGDEAQKFAARNPTFDARVWNVPTEEEAANTVLWRELDASKNSISMAAHHYFGHQELQGKSSADKLVMLESVGIVWGQYPSFFKRGTFFQKRTRYTAFTPEEIAKLPPKHQAHQNPGLTVGRSSVEKLAMPPFGKVLNRADVCCNGADPRWAEPPDGV